MGAARPGAPYRLGLGLLPRPCGGSWEKAESVIPQMTGLASEPRVGQVCTKLESRVEDLLTKVFQTLPFFLMESSRDGKTGKGRELDSYASCRGQL